MTEKARILVVDDTAANVRLLEQVLLLAGYEVVTAASGEEGLAKVVFAKPDLVLLDVVMPEMSGYEACRALLKACGFRDLFSARDLGGQPRVTGGRAGPRG